LLPDLGDSEHSWTVARADIEDKNYDLKAVSPEHKKNEVIRSPKELLDLIEAKGRLVSEAVAALRTSVKLKRISLCLSLTTSQPSGFLRAAPHGFEYAKEHECQLDCANPS
jgi:hypothetical protein